MRDASLSPDPLSRLPAEGPREAAGRGRQPAQLRGCASCTGLAAPGGAAPRWRRQSERGRLLAEWCHLPRELGPLIHEGTREPDCRGVRRGKAGARLGPGGRGLQSPGHRPEERRVSPARL